MNLFRIQKYKKRATPTKSAEMSIQKEHLFGVKEQISLYKM